MQSASGRKGPIVMSIKTKRAVAIIATLLWLSISASSQQSKSPSIDDLKRQIGQLVAVELDETMPAEVKDLNRKFIHERRVQLRALLQKKVDGLRKYQATAGSSLTAEESQQIQDSAASATKDLQTLENEMQAEPAVSESASRPAAPLVQESTTVAEEPPLVTPKPKPLSTEEVKTLVAARPGANASETPKFLDKELETDKNDIVSRIISARKNSVLRQKAGNKIFLRNPLFFARLLSANVLPREQFTKEIEEARVDEQVGGTSTAGGSTSLVSKGSIPAVLGFAVENGGLTRNDQGTTITFRGNVVGLFEAFAGKGFIDSYDDDSLTARRLRKLSFGLSYDTSTGNDAGIFLGNRQQLSSYSFRYEFFNKRDPRNPRYANQWADLINNNAQAVANSLNGIQILFRENPVLNDWSQSAAQAINAAPDEDVARVVEEQLDNLQKLALPDTVKDAISSFTQDFIEYRHKKSRLLDIVANGPIFTVEYLNNRRPGLIDTSTFNFIYGTGLAEGKLNFTLNGAATLFNSNPGQGMKRIRDFNFATQLDWPLGDPRGFGQFVLSFSGQYKRLTENEMIFNGAIMHTKGDIGTGNLKLEIPIKALGMKLPLSLTYDNRTEFDFKKQLRGNFGLTFDPDILFTLLRPFTPK
jgi:hypothetical protein